MPPSENFTVACPRCCKRYVVAPAAIGKKATCKCGKTFVVQVPEDDEEDEGGDYEMNDHAAEQAPKGPQCKWHPGVAAHDACARCHSFLCPTCTVHTADGRYLCSDCAQVLGVEPASGRTAR